MTKELLWTLRPSHGSACTFIYDTAGKFVALMSEAAKADAERIVQEHNMRVLHPEEPASGKHE